MNHHLIIKLGKTDEGCPNTNNYPDFGHIRVSHINSLFQKVGMILKKKNRFSRKVEKDSLRKRYAKIQKKLRRYLK